jgi:hypothetical protein
MIPCDECRAIYSELREALRTARNSAPTQSLVDWLQSADEEEWARLRESSPLWKTYRRLREHRARTGHMLSVLPIPPEALSNPN